jgi:hypothetical protein
VLGWTLGVVATAGLIVPLTMAITHQAPWGFAAGLAAFSILLSCLCGYTFKHHSALAFDSLLFHWAAYLVVFTVFAVPLLDRQWLPVRKPYQAARTLEDHGVRVFAGGLNETMMGYAGLELHHDLPELNSLASVEQALASPGPIAILADGGFWTGTVQGRARLSEVQLFDEVQVLKGNPQLLGRAPRLLLNEAARPLLGRMYILK